MTMSRALVTLAQQGVEAEAAGRARLAAAYEQFMSAEDPARKSEIGQELIQAIFGKAALAEDPLRRPSTFTLATHSRKGGGASDLPR